MAETLKLHQKTTEPQKNFMQGNDMVDFQQKKSNQSMGWKKTGVRETGWRLLKYPQAKYLSASPNPPFPTSILMQILSKRAPARGHQGEVRAYLETL